MRTVPYDTHPGVPSVRVHSRKWTSPGCRLALTLSVLMQAGIVCLCLSCGVGCRDQAATGITTASSPSAGTLTDAQAQDRERAPATPTSQPTNTETDNHPARKLILSALGANGAETRVVLRHNQESHSVVYAEVTPVSGKYNARAAVTLTDGGALLGSLTIERPKQAGEAMPLAKARDLARTTAQKLYPRWRDCNMTLTYEGQEQLGPSTSGGQGGASCYHFIWTESPQPRYRTHNRVEVSVDGVTGELVGYGASFAQPPLSYPVVDFVDARRIAETEVAARMGGQGVRWMLDNAFCALGETEQPPVWLFEYEWEARNEAGPGVLSGRYSVRVDGLTGIVMPQP